MIKRYLPVLFLLVFLLPSCNLGRKGTATGTGITANNLSQLQVALERTRPEYRWLRMRARASVSSGGQSYDNISAYIKMRDDSLIWGNASLILQVGRLLVTKDSAKVINYLGQGYEEYPVSGLKDMLAIEGLDLKAVQRLLIAYPPFGIKNDAKWEKEEGSINLTYQDASYKERMEIDESLMRMRSYYYEKNATQYVRINYSDFKEVGNMMLPQKVDFEIATPDKNLISLDIRDFTLLDADDAPFVVPDSYRKK